LHADADQSYLLLHDKRIALEDSLNPRIILPYEVVSISRINTSAGFDFIGVKEDSEWLFKVRRGK